MLESSQIIYLARGTKISLAILAAFIMVLTLYTISLFFGREGYADYVLVGASLLNTMVIVIFVGGILFFGERDANISDLKRRSDDYLKRIVGDALRHISIPEAGIYGMDCRVYERKENIGRVFHISAIQKKTLRNSASTLVNTESDVYRAKIWIGLNVYRFLIIYYVPIPDDDLALRASELEQVFKFTLTGAKTVGYSSVFQPTHVESEALCSIWLVANAEKDILTDPKSKLFWAQDIAMMTESFLRAAYHNDIPFCSKADPGPL